MEVTRRRRLSAEPRRWWASASVVIGPSSAGKNSCSATLIAAATGSARNVPTIPNAVDPTTTAKSATSGWRCTARPRTIGMITTFSIWRRTKRLTTAAMASVTPPDRERDDRDDRARDERPDQRDDVEQPDHHAERDRERQPEDRPEHDRDDDRHQHDEQQLAAQPLSDDDVDPARDLRHLDPIGGLEESERRVPEAASVEQQVERDDDRQDDVERPAEQPFRRSDRALGGLQERGERRLGLGGQLLGRERHVADRDAVSAEDLLQRGRQGVGPAIDQQRDLAGDRGRRTRGRAAR